jgi:CheY-like chemotaxis protein
MSDKTILVVDDEPDVVAFLGNLLADHGYAVQRASAAREAWELIQATPPDLILLDLQMPNDTGTDLYRRLQGRKDLKSIPVIVVSGLPGRHLAVSKSVAAFDKPIDEQRLLTEVQRVLNK